MGGGVRFFSVGIMALVLGYVLSQFYRAFLAVLAPVLGDALGATPGDLALSSGLWFVAFAAFQIPVGWALDRFGPRRTVALLLALGGAGGAAVFALATAPWHVHVAMALLGVGCSPVLMASYFIFARSFAPARFGALAGGVVGIGSLGNILGAAPLVAVTQAIGWRETLWAMAAITLAVAAVQWLAVRDPARLPADQPRGSLRDVLAIRALWFILPLFGVNYASVAAVRGLWASPWLDQVYGADATTIGRATLAMGLAMVAGSFLVGPWVRLVGNLRRAIAWMAGAMALTLAVMAAVPSAGLMAATAGLVALGLTGSSYPLLMAHGRSFLPPHLLGRGVTFLNMFSIGGAGVMQFASRPVYDWAQARFGPDQVFALLWLFFLIPTVAGVLIYLKTPEAAHVQ